MANGKKGSSATNEQIVETPVILPVDANVPPVDPANDPANVPPVDPPVNVDPPVIPAHIAKLNEERAKVDAENQTKLADLDLALENANIAYVKALTENKYKQVEAVVNASKLVVSSDNAIIEFKKTLDALNLERAEVDAKNLAKDDLCFKFGCTIEVLEKLIIAAKDEKDTLKPSFNTVFGKFVVRLDNKNRKDLTTTSGSNGSTEGEKKGDKWAEGVADLTAGMTYDELLQKYPTKKNDGSIDYNFLNGTIRTIINKEGWEKQDNGSYILKGKESK